MDLCPFDKPQAVNVKQRLIFAGLAVAVIVLFVVLMLFPINPPESIELKTMMSAGDVRRTIAGPLWGRRRTHNARRILWESTNGPLGVYALEDVDVKTMLKLTEDLKNGSPPADCVARKTGAASGRLDLPVAVSHVRYLVLYRAVEDTVVTIRVSYGRD